jgi:hypothetical protein
MAGFLVFVVRCARIQSQLVPWRSPCPCCLSANKPQVYIFPRPLAQERMRLHRRLRVHLHLPCLCGRCHRQVLLHRSVGAARVRQQIWLEFFLLVMTGKAAMQDNATLQRMFQRANSPHRLRPTTPTKQSVQPLTCRLLNHPGRPHSRSTLTNKPGIEFGICTSPSGWLPTRKVCLTLRAL